MQQMKMAEKFNSQTENKNLDFQILKKNSVICHIAENPQ